MTNNERIAEWLGWTWHTKTLAKTPNSCIWLRHGPEEYQWEPWPPGTDITLWHGEDGLLAEIAQRKLQSEFTNLVGWATCGSEIVSDWDILTASPVQLTAALIKLIEETE